MKLRDAGGFRPVGLLYAEDRCAWRWPMVVAGVVAPIMALSFFVALLFMPKMWPLSIPALVCGMAWVLRGALLIIQWPLAIRIYDKGVMIGAVTRRLGFPRIFSPAGITWACHLAHGVLWAGVRRIDVVSYADARRVRVPVRTGGYPVEASNPPGVLLAWRMRWALLIEVDLAKAAVPQFRDRNGRPYPPSTTWLVPLVSRRSCGRRWPGCRSSTARSRPRPTVPRNNDRAPTAVESGVIDCRRSRPRPL